MKISALLFDMDGLLVDTERLYFEVERELCARWGITVSNEVLFEAMGRAPLEACNILAEKLGLPVSGAEFLELRTPMMIHKMKTELEPMKGVFEILAAFRGKVKMAVVTGATQVYLDITLDKLDIRGYFDELITSDGITRGKPDPEIYLRAVEKLAVPTSECVVIEDSRNGCLAGIAAGCMALAVPDEFTAGQDFSCANVICRDLLEARDWILKEGEF